MSQDKSPKSNPPPPPPPKQAPKIAPDPSTMTTVKKDSGDAPGKETRIIKPGQ